MLDASLLFVGLAALLWGAALLARGIGQLLALLAAPIALAVALPMRLDVVALAVAPVVVLSAVPLVRALGPARPRAVSFLIAGGALVLALAFLLTPPGRLLLASDLANGAFVVALGAGLLACSPLRV